VPYSIFDLVDTDTLAEADDISGAVGTREDMAAIAVKAVKFRTPR